MSTPQHRGRRARFARETTLAAFIISAALAAVPAAAEKDPVFTSRGNLAIRGYDPVAYFTEGKAVKGDKDFTLGWQGADWRFASAENRDRFSEDPEKYAPQYGGYCAWAVSRNYTAPTDPDAFTLVDGKLYLNYNKRVMRQWLEDRDANIESADKNWPTVLKE
ncbi:MAG: YHS domain-containing protein [Holophagales bacterium]|nr:YHS domain-containing protein [Holophagales bacterium]MYF04131.1 YHS domain-containing protein [Holophagales bacterium]MYJ24897.1 YHS domain-containing protein [Holophagales bacterium]